MPTYMSDYLSLDLLADHIRHCLVLTENLAAIKILQRASRELEDLSQELRTHLRRTAAEGEDNR